MESDPVSLLSSTMDQVVLGSMDVIVNLAAAVILGLAVALVYRRTHSGISYSQGFVISLLLVTIIASAAIMVIGSSLARAFGLVGALGIIRYRTVVKDVRDAAYIFLALVVGFACGVGAFHIAVLTAAVVLGLVILLTRYHFGIMHFHDFILSFVFTRGEETAAEYRAVLEKHCSRAKLIHVEPGGEDGTLFLSFDVSLMEGVDSTELVDALRRVPGLQQPKLVSATNDGTV
ncbi:MAG: DUF4956 domain-containing protein [Burkholderiales bacterium]|nr:DUF4956 domain-containing protein [Burkholderiales bacterium]